MTSVEWIYEPDADIPTRKERKAAMDYADKALRELVTPKGTHSDVEREALRIRKSELVWSDIAPPSKSQFVRVGISQIFWAVISAQLCLGFLAWLLWLLVHS